MSVSWLGQDQKSGRIKGKQCCFFNYLTVYSDLVELFVVDAVTIHVLFFGEICGWLEIFRSRVICVPYMEGLIQFVQRKW
jgi:hypothetical protein